MSLLTSFLESFASTVRNVVPITAVILFFQFAVLRRPIHNPRIVAIGTIFMLFGLTLFLKGLDLALFPLGERMAVQLTSDEFLGAANQGPARPWTAYFWTYVFAFALGASTSIAEPSLIAVATKAEKISAGTIDAYWLRIVVAFGVGSGAMFGVLRIVTGLSLTLSVSACYVAVVVQSRFAPKVIVPLAYDSGSVTTTTVTVPLVTALSLGLASSIPGRDPLTDGFGVISFAVLFPIMSVMTYARIAQWWAERGRDRPKPEQIPDRNRETSSE